MSSSGVYPYKSAFLPNRPDRAIKAKAARIAKGRYKNKKVVSKLKSKGPVKTIVKGNKNAILTLSRQVKTLQLDKFGSIQRMSQFLNVAHDGTHKPLSTEPMLMCFNQFKELTPLYHCAVSQTPPTTGIPTLLASHLFAKSAFSTDLADEYQWEDQSNLTTSVSSVEYLPVYANLKIQLTGQLAQTDPVIRYRFTLFKTKRLPAASLQKNFSLPHAGGAYYHMCEDDVSLRNQFSKSYHQILMDKWITIIPPNPYTSTHKVHQVVNLPYSFGKIESLKLNYSALPAGQTLTSNIPQKDCIWLLISCNQPTSSPINLAITRDLTWRDRHQVMA